jgi:peptidoglycan hydrolase-like protein with peptidoglycan-binding domain
MNLDSKIKGFAILLLVVLSTFLGTSKVEAYMWSRNLSLGDIGPDVMELQKFLNQTSLTRIASAGPGSAGNETLYFGELTRYGVIKFQEKYASDILRPLGLTRGTGYVGPSTRSKLAELSARGISDTINLQPSNTPSSAQPILSIKPQIFSVTPSTGPIGTKVVLEGTGFDKTNNTVYASFAKLENIPSKDGSRIEFEVALPFPKDLIDNLPDDRAKYIPDFKYEFIVENKNGRSGGVSFILQTNF